GLTVFKKFRDCFDIHLIPETRKATILADKKQGDPVHLETDMLFKYVQAITKEKSQLSVEELLNAGF
ncbi:riboflavin synthase, partial [Staphylococcus pseudintermedius]